MADSSSDRRLSELRSEWERLAERDAFHAVLSDPARSGGGWDAETFYASGRYSVDLILKHVHEHGGPIAHGTALELGCGAGRLSIALADHFDRVVGVDISAPMIERARAFGVPDNCELLVQYEPALPALKDARFDLVLTMLVIQHMHPRLGRAYLSALARRVAPGGTLLCQVPYAYARNPPGSPDTQGRSLFRRFAPGFLMSLRRRIALRRDEARLQRAGEPIMERHRIPMRTVRKLLEHEGLTIVHVDDEHEYETPPLLSAWYLAQRPGGPST